MLHCFFHKRRSISALLVFCALSSFADIGETFDMLNKREQIVKENARLLNGRNIDSLSKSENSRYIENLHIIQLLDEEIFKSQQSTINRLSNTSGSDRYVNKSVALMSFFLAAILAISIYMLYLLNARLNRFAAEKKTFYARMQELFSVLLINFQPSGENKKEVAVNGLIVLGLVFMFVSFLGFLLKTLGV